MRAAKYIESKGWMKELKYYKKRTSYRETKIKIRKEDNRNGKRSKLWGREMQRVKI